MQVQYLFPGPVLHRTQLRQRPATGCEIANLDKSVRVLESDDGGIGTKVALVVQGR